MSLHRRDFLSRGTVVMAGGSLITSADAQDESETSEVGAFSYRLPDFEQRSRLLFQGDSITDMKWGRNQSDRNHYLGHSYVFLIASRLGVDMPEARLDFYNRGMSGHKVNDLRVRWQRDAIDMKPDLLSILIGVNDAGKNLDGVDMEAWEADYRFLLDSSRKDNPQLRIVLMDPFVLESDFFSKAEALRKRRVQVERMFPVVEKLAKEFDAVHIRTQKVFDTAAGDVSPEHWIWDGVHPLPQGHELIARHWIHAVSRRWPRES